MAQSQSILSEVYTQLETTWGTTPNSSGSATVANGDFMLHTSLNMRPVEGQIDSSDKTGSIATPPGSPGARNGEWELEWEARPSGVAGTAPDCTDILIAAFGQNPTVVASTSVEYTLANIIKSFTLWNFRQPSTVMQRWAPGCVVQELSFDAQINQNLKLRAKGQSLFVADTASFASLDVTGRGGITVSGSIVKPSAPVSNGDVLNSLVGTATLDGNVTAGLRSTQITLATAISAEHDTILSGQYPSVPGRDRLQTTINLELFDADDAAVLNLYNKAISGTRIPIVLQFGNTAGRRITWTFAECKLPPPALGDSQRKWISSLQGIRAYYTAGGTTLDECKMKWH